jgi:hypothetical protein
MTSLRLTPARALSALRKQSLHWLLTILLLGGFSARGKAQTTTADEYEIRAAMLLNLTKFIEWPNAKVDAAHPQFLICILGPDPIGPGADRYLQNQNVGGKPVHVRHLSSTEAVNSCQILYVAESEHKNIERFAPELMKSGVLTISERSNATSPNQVIGLPTLNERVHIDINLGAAKRTGLTISSKLLRLATVTP